MLQTRQETSETSYPADTECPEIINFLTTTYKRSMQGR